MKFYRVLFAVAALYNIFFGLWATLFPGQFFSLLDLQPLPYPSIWACLGMVVGLYGLLYAHVAWKPENGDFLIAVGLLGKILGPIGWLLSIWRNELPPRTVVLVLINDLIWWFPFLFYLLRKHRRRRTILMSLTVGIHIIACLGLVAVRGGGEMETDMGRRLQWVRAFTPLWTTVWFSWILASLSFLSFAVAWSKTLLATSTGRATILVACGLAVVGVLCDLTGEWVNLSRLTHPLLTLDQFEQGARAYLLWSAAAANGLYCIAGLILSFESWKTALVRGPIGVLGIIMWVSGLGLTISALWNARAAIVLTGEIVMILFVPWAALMAWTLRSRPA